MTVAELHPVPIRFVNLGDQFGESGARRPAREVRTHRRQGRRGRPGRRRGQEEVGSRQNECAVWRIRSSSVEQVAVRTGRVEDQRILSAHRFAYPSYCPLAVSTRPRRDFQTHLFHEHLQVFPGLLLGRRLSEQIGRVVSDDGGDAAVTVPLAAQLAHGDAWYSSSRLHGDPAEQAEKLGPDDGDLLFQVREAVVRLFDCGSAVFGGTALEDVGDVDLIARQAHPLGDHVGEQLAGPADERLAQAVFVGSRRLADEHEPGLGLTGAEDRLGAGLRQVRTPAADGDLGWPGHRASPGGRRPARGAFKLGRAEQRPPVKVAGRRRSAGRGNGRRRRWRDGDWWG